MSEINPDLSSVKETYLASPLGLHVPAQLPPPKNSFLLDRRATTQWIAGLPMADVGETTRQLFRTLFDFNRYSLPVSLRAKISEQFQTPLAYICENLKRHYMNTGFPASDKAGKTASLSRELNSELATSYKIIIEQLLADKADYFDRKLLVIAIHRALYYLSQVLVQTALVYAPWPKGIWRELHTLYAFAQRNGIHQACIKMKIDGNFAVSSIEQQYKALLLLASATPFRLRQHDIARLYEETLEWAGHTELKFSEECEPGNGRLGILLAADEPPIHTILQTPLPGRQALILDTRPLLKNLKKDLDTAPLGNAPDRQKASRALPRQLLQQSITALDCPPDKAFRRTHLNFELNLLVGLPQIYAGIAALPGSQSEGHGIAKSEQSGEIQRTFAEDEALAPFQLMRDSQLNGLSHLDLSIAPLEGTPLSEDSLMKDSLLNTSGGSTTHVIDDWRERSAESIDPIDSKTSPLAVRTQNESAGGYCIRWSSGENAPKVKIDELIGISSSTKKHPFNLGVVRWLRRQGGKELDLGLQIISRSVRAAQLQPTEDLGSSSPGEAPSNCLVLLGNNQEPNSESASLIVGEPQFAVDSEAWLHLDGNKGRIRLNKLIECNSAFSRYQFNLSTEKESKTHDQNASGDTYEDLWGAL